MHDELFDVGGKGELFDQLLMCVVKIVSGIKETVGEAADQTVGIFKIAGKGIVAGACRNVAVEIFVLFEKLFHHSPGKDGTLGGNVDRSLVIP